eukprot:5322979-Amphidinium_carterae.1
MSTVARKNIARRKFGRNKDFSCKPLTSVQKKEFAKETQTLVRVPASLEQYYHPTQKAARVLHEFGLLRHLASEQQLIARSALASLNSASGLTRRSQLEECRHPRCGVCTPKSSLGADKPGTLRLLSLGA